MSEQFSEASAPEPITRRTFSQRVLLWITVGAGFVAALAVAIPFVGYLLGPARRNRVRWVNLGPVSKFPHDQTRLETFENPLAESWDGVTGNNAVYVRNLGSATPPLESSGGAALSSGVAALGLDQGRDQFLVFAVNCAHLGCPVTWFPQSGLFMCPCHGGVYYENGEHASGPPPRGLFHCVWRVRQGNLEIQAPHFPTLHNTLKDKG